MGAVRAHRSVQWVGIRTFTCHGQDELFLLEADVDPDELEANRDVIVGEVPESR